MKKVYVAVNKGYKTKNMKKKIKFLFIGHDKT